MNLKPYLEKGLSYNEYINEITEQAHQKTNSLNQPNELYPPFIDLNLKRMERVNKTFRLNKEIEISKVKNFLVISEGWCGDAGNILPVINQIALHTNTRLKILFRDQNSELMTNYLTNGAHSIPIIIALDDNDNELFHWGPRTKQGTALLKEYKENKAGFNKEEFYKNLQIYYAKNKGEDIVNEIEELILN